MKKVKLIILTLLTTVVLYGQDYLPVINKNSIWSVLNEKYTLLGDTVINNVDYQKIYYHKGIEEFNQDELTYLCGIREDTETGKVWLIWKDHEEEFLLYDFSLNIDDVFDVKGPEYSNNSEPEYIEGYGEWRQVVVSDIFHKEIDGISRKILKVHGSEQDGTFLYEYWIEGIGSTKGLIYGGITSEMVGGGQYPLLVCLHKDEELIYEYDPDYLGDPIFPDTFEDCFGEAPVNVSEISEEKVKVTVYPTVFDHKITIKSKVPINNIKVFDHRGSLVYEKRNTGLFHQITLDTTDWKAGFYLLITNNMSKSTSFKIIKY